MQEVSRKTNLRKRVDQSQAEFLVSKGVKSSMNTWEAIDHYSVKDSNGAGNEQEAVPEPDE